MIVTKKWYGLLPPVFITLLAGIGLLVAQTMDTDEPWGRDEAAAYFETQKASSLRREIAEGGINDPFTGITSNGNVRTGLYSVKSTGVSTAPIVNAAKAFLDTLNQDEKDRVSFAIDDVEWRKWANQAGQYRDGLWFQFMSEKQRDAAIGLLAASLSADGLKTARDIMKTNETLGELTGDYFAKYGEWKYWLSIMGEPSATEPWGWQLDGHHLIINFFVMGDQVVMTPSFWGAEPTIAEAGKFKGTEVLKPETLSGLELIQSMTQEQQRRAIIQEQKDGANILTQAFSDNVIIPFSGIPVSELNNQQKDLLRKVIGQWVGKMRPEHAKIRMAEIEEYMDETYFAWIGATDDDAVFYYRIQSPVVLIEFDHQRPQGLTNLYKFREAYREHIHAVVRTPNGNDYGKDLLRQHYETHAHGIMDENGVAHWHSD